jgi:hypothetical protein
MPQWQRDWWPHNTRSCPTHCMNSWPKVLLVWTTQVTADANRMSASPNPYSPFSCAARPRSSALPPPPSFSCVRFSFPLPLFFASAQAHTQLYVLRSSFLSVCLSVSLSLCLSVCLLCFCSCPCLAIAPVKRTSSATGATTRMWTGFRCFHFVSCAF